VTDIKGKNYVTSHVPWVTNIEQYEISYLFVS